MDRPSGRIVVVNGSPIEYSAKDASALASKYDRRLLEQQKKDNQRPKMSTTQTIIATAVLRRFPELQGAFSWLRPEMDAKWPATFSGFVVPVMVNYPGGASFPTDMFVFKRGPRTEKQVTRPFGNHCVFTCPFNAMKRRDAFPGCERFDGSYDAIGLDMEAFWNPDQGGPNITDPRWLDYSKGRLRPLTKGRKRKVAPTHPMRPLLPCHSPSPSGGCGGSRTSCKGAQAQPTPSPLGQGRCPGKKDEGVVLHGRGLVDPLRFGRDRWFGSTLSAASWARHRMIFRTTAIHRAWPSCARCSPPSLSSRRC
jgi:hypothetical protein